MELSTLTTFNLGILVLFIGKLFNQRFSILRRYNIPEPVSSGLLGGTTSLVGGHGTAIAWTPVYRDSYG